MITDEEQAALRLLVQHVTRAFYEPKFIIVMDQLARHQVLKDDDLAGRMGLQLKELNKIMAVLESDRLVQVHRQNELKEGAQRAVGRQYFFLDFRHFCNVVKWRVAEMRRIIDTSLRNELDNKGYVCPQCGKQYTPLEVDKLIDFARGAFVCEVCHGELIDNENAENVRGSQDRMQRFNFQMRHIREGLRRSEEMVMPAFDVAQYISKHLLDAAAALAMSGEPGAGLKVAGASGSRMQDDGVGIVLSIDKDADTLRREREEEAASRRQQNALPAWHLKSTISGDLTALGIKETARSAENGVGVVLEGNLDDSLRGLGRVGGSLSLEDSQDGVELSMADVKPVIRDDPEADSALFLLFLPLKTYSYRLPVYDHYYASLATSTAPTPAFSQSASLPDDEEDRKPDVAALDALNANRKRSRSQEDEGDAERKFARTDAHTNGFSEDVPSASTGDDPTVHVNGKPMPFSLVTEEHQELMTPEEYEAYFQVYTAQTG
ncbi:TFIIE alpha subunit-domain-containing protein [Amylostereum chailletii]|nr:TFIIE alpha subunit-domain-containing protein [Amylostereum chailletii]